MHYLGLQFIFILTCDENLKNIIKEPLVVTV